MNTNLRINRKNLVSEVHDRLVEILNSGKYAPGDRLPSENELAELFGVNRATVREGLRILQEERLIITRHGFGRFVASKSKEILRGNITHLRSVTELARELGIEIGTRVLSVREELPASDVAESLALQLGEKAVVVERLRLAKDVPVIYSVDIFSKSLVVGDLDPLGFEGSLVNLMEEKWNTQLVYSKSVISAVLLDLELCKRIHVLENLPWILMEQVNYDDKDFPILYSRDYHRGDYFNFTVFRRRK